MPEHETSSKIHDSAQAVNTTPTEFPGEGLNESNPIIFDRRTFLDKIKSAAITHLTTRPMLNRRVAKKATGIGLSGFATRGLEITTNTRTGKYVQQKGETTIRLIKEGIEEII